MFDPENDAENAPLFELIGRCADGELNDAQRAELLARLSAEPAGFESLALALLERRLTDDALRGLLRDGAERGPAPVVPARRPAWRRAAGPLAGLAAGLLVGFGLNPSAAGPAPAAGPLVDVPPVPEPIEEEIFTPAAVPEPRPVASLEWFAPDGTPVSLPVYDGSAPLPADPLLAETEALMRAGRFGGAVRQEYTVPLADGRLLTVPVHAVSVRGPEVF